MRTRGRGLNARYDRLVGGAALVRSLGKRKGSTESDIANGAKRYKVDPAIEPGSSRTARRGDHLDDRARDHGGGPSSGGGADVYLGEDEDQQSSSVSQIDPILTLSQFFVMIATERDFSRLLLVPSSIPCSHP